MKKISLFTYILLCYSAITSLVQSSYASEFTINEIGAAYGYGYDFDVSHWAQIDLISAYTLPFEEISNTLDTHQIESYLDFGLAANQWQKSGDEAYHATLSLMLRTTLKHCFGGDYFFEAGFGPHLVSHPDHTDRISTNIEFNSHLGAGVFFAENWGLMVRARHISNGGVRTPNPGVNILLLQLQYRFDP